MMELMLSFLGGYKLNLGGESLLIDSVPVLQERKRCISSNYHSICSNKVVYLCVIGILLPTGLLLLFWQIIWEFSLY